MYWEEAGSEIDNGCRLGIMLSKLDTFDGAKPRFLNRGKKRRSVSTLSPSVVLGALSLSKGIPRASDRGVEWVDPIGCVLNRLKGNVQ
jgi:hypothetical protein